MNALSPIGSTDHLLHIGPHKTGSTAIQVALFGVRDRLAELSVYYPGQKRRRREASEGLFAAMKRGETTTPEWEALVAEVAAVTDMRVCVSDEQFGKGTHVHAEKIVTDLGGDNPHIVAVARGYDRYLPSQWQERVKAGVTASYEEWLRTIFDPESTDWERQNVWTAHDTPDLVTRWTSLVDPSRFTLVVADERNRDQLPRTFEALLGLPTGILQPKPGRSNESLSLTQVELIRAVGLRLESAGLPFMTYRQLMKQVLRDVRTTVAPSGPGRPQTPRWARELIAELTAKRVEFLRQTDVTVVGDPAWLVGAPVDEPIAGEWSGEPVEPPADVVAGIADKVLATV